MSIQKIIKEDLIILVLLIGYSLSIVIPKGIFYPSNNEDGNRDYLVAHHIVKYQEIPLVGPYNSLFSWGNSPLYYYILALFLLIRDEAMFLGVIAVLFQLLTMILIYFLAKNLFGQKEAVMSSILFVPLFSLITSRHTEYVMQPWVMQPFMVLSYVLMFLSYTKKSYKLLLSSALTLSFASSISNHGLSILPIFLIFSFAILKQQKAIYLQHILLFVILTGGFLVFYLPHLFYFTTYKINAPFIIESTIIFHPLEYAKNLLQNLYIFGSYLYDSTIYVFQLFSKPLTGYLLVLILLVSSITYLTQKDLPRKLPLSRKLILVLLSISFLQPLIFASIAKNTPFYYFAPSYSLLVVILSGLIFSLPFLSKSLPRLKKASINLLIVLTTVSLVLGLPSTVEFLTNSFNSNYKEARTEVNITLKSEILKIKNEENKDNLNFFQIRSYNEHGSRSGDAVFLVPLEKDLESKFTKVINETNSFQQTNDKEFVFLICKYAKEDSTNFKDCRDTFSEETTKYAFLRTIYLEYPFTIYLAGRNE